MFQGNSGEPRGVGRARILVCDDASTMRAMMGALLGRAHDLLLTSTAEEALARAPEFSPDLVISDLVLPGMSGRELLLRLRAIPAFAEVPMVLLSAVSDVEARVRGLEDGADDYLVKPVRERELLARVAALLRLRRTMLALSQRSRELEDVNAALRAAQERLVRAERLAAIGSLAAALSHDINNPLSLVTSGASAIAAIAAAAVDAPEPLDLQRLQGLMREVRDVAGEVGEGGRRLQEVGGVLRLFDVAPPDPGARADAVAAAESAIGLARARCAAPPEISLDVRARVTVDAPAHLVTLVLLSLVDRAVQAAGAGGRVRVEVGAAPSGAEISVEDDGPPIPIHLLPSVFEPFARLHPSGPAAGLGLAVAAGIVQGLGGNIDVAVPGPAGTRFSVRLPSGAAAPA